MRKRAFTLIEMLVVIGIIGILAGLLSGPVMRSVRKAQGASCLNNLKQAGYALEMYRTANRQFPWAANWADVVYTDGAVTPFSLPPISVALKNETPPEIFHCPADDRGYYRNGRSSYEWNARLSGRQGDPRGHGGRALKPSMVTVLWDAEAFHGTTSTTVEEVSGGAAGDDVEEVEVRSSSDGSRNMLYLDNSVNPL